MLAVRTGAEPIRGGDVHPEPRAHALCAVLEVRRALVTLYYTSSLILTRSAQPASPSTGHSVDDMNVVWALQQCGLGF